MTDGADRGGAVTPTVVLRPLANPLPLGFIALAVATTIVAAPQLGWIEASEQHSIALVLLVFVAPIQWTVSVLSYWSRDVVAGTGMGILAGTWASVGVITLGGEPGVASKTVGLLFVVAAIAMSMPALAAFSSKIVPAAVLATTSLRFLVTGIYHLTASPRWKTASGVIGVALAALALFAALALVLEDARHETVLPLLRRGAGADALTGDFATEVSNIEHEAGVRDQL
jgi:succinate-acetate transporter protein